MSDARAVIVIQRGDLPSCALVILPLPAEEIPAKLRMLAVNDVGVRDRVQLPSRGPGRTATLEDVLATAEFWSQALGISIMDIA